MRRIRSRTSRARPRRGRRKLEQSAGKSFETTKSVPCSGSTAAPPKLAPPLLPGISIVFVSPGGVNSPSLRAPRMSSRNLARLRGVVDERAQVLFRERLPRERRRSGREGLRRPRFLSGHVALRHRPLFDRPQRLRRSHDRRHRGILSSRPARRRRPSARRAARSAASAPSHCRSPRCRGAPSGNASSRLPVRASSASRQSPNRLAPVRLAP